MAAAEAAAFPESPGRQIPMDDQVAPLASGNDTAFWDDWRQDPRPVEGITGLLYAAAASSCCFLAGCHAVGRCAIIDFAWNGSLESVKIAAMANAYEVNVAPHNQQPSGSQTRWFMCAAIPIPVAEIDIDDVTGKDDVVTMPPVIEIGDLVLPKAPG
jgi:Enolase C-terminal domain-like